ncbi:MAG: hypothetical protein KDC34_17155 [Saprospiraceae bacterium]|nr:hypothetical protein [Saprospiraceae bacterium]
MKNLFLLFVLSFFFLDCGSDATQTEGPDTDVASSNVASKVWHYTCPNNHPEGGSDAQGVCSTCQTQLAHNQAWHDLPENQAQSQPANSNQESPIIQQNVTPKDPPQNAKGVWHYVCNNGCAGGGGAEGPCSVCGSPLAHNALYHQ